MLCRRYLLESDQNVTDPLIQRHAGRRLWMSSFSLSSATPIVTVDIAQDLRLSRSPDLLAPEGFLGFFR